MKTQTLPGLLENVFFPVFPITTEKSNRGGGFNLDSQPRLKLRLEPAGAKQISDRKVVRRGHSGLPASLADWLGCNKALEICRRGANGTKNGNHAWVATDKPGTPAKILSAAGVRP